MAIILAQLVQPFIQQAVTYPTRLDRITATYSAPLIFRSTSYYQVDAINANNGMLNFPSKL